MSNYPYRGRNQFPGSFRQRPSEGQWWGRHNGNRNPQYDSNSNYRGTSHSYHDYSRYENCDNRRHQDTSSSRYSDPDNDRKRSASPPKAYASKKQHTDSSNKVDGNSSMEKLKHEIEDLLQFGHAGYYPPEAFIRQDGWEEKMVQAAEKTKEVVLPMLKAKLNKAREEKESCVSDPDNSSDESDICGNNPGPADDKYELDRLSKFIMALPGCRLMDLGFHIYCKSSSDSTDICTCPCSRQNVKWRRKFGLGFVKVCNEDSKKSKSKPTSFEPSGLMKHLEKMGGFYSYKDKKTREQVHVGLVCEFHYATFEYLHELFKDYYGTIGHEGLYNKGDDNHKKAESARDRRKQLEKQTLVNHNINLAAKNIELAEENKQLKEGKEDSKK